MLKNWIPLWVIPTVFFFSIGTVWLRLAVVRTTYSIHQTERSLQKVEQDRGSLQLKWAALRSPRRLEELARTKFGLLQPKLEQIVHLKIEETVGDDP